MIKSLISNKIVFPSTESQIKYISDIKIKSGLKNKDLALKWGVNSRTLFDWSRGKYKIPYDLATALSSEYKVELPKNAKKVTWQEITSKAGIKGGAMNWIKNGMIGGDTENRKIKWEKWWADEGRFKSVKILTAKDVSIPKKGELLAEFVGIMLGDGGISSYQATITLNKNELTYAKFIIKLIKSLFKSNAKIYPRKDCNAMDLVVHRKKIVNFLLEIGLVKGGKIEHGADIPKWIMDDIKLQKACIRGLIDTDGSVFVHRYISSGKIYKYKKIEFSSSSKPLLISTYNILSNLGFRVRMCKSGVAIRIESQKDVALYLKIIGTNNDRYSGKQIIDSSVYKR